MTPEQIAEMMADREAGTLGPWVVDGPVWSQIVWADGETRLCFMAHSNGLNDARDEADARRIARVPDMEAEILRLRAALEEIMADCEADYPPSHGAIRQFARTALNGGA